MSEGRWGVEISGGGWQGWQVGSVGLAGWQRQLLLLLLLLRLDRLHFAVLHDLFALGVLTHQVEEKGLASEIVAAA